MKKTGVVLCLLLSACFATLCQAGSIAGRVLDSSTGKGIRRITVRAFGHGQSVVFEASTENDGSYTFSELPGGTYAVYFGPEDPTWKEPREDWKREVIYQEIKIQPNTEYELTAWILTGDRGSGWGRDSRIRLAVDETNAGLLENIDTVDQANATQWFATQHLWMPVTLRFKAKNDRCTIGAEFLQWWALEACHLYIDDFSVHPVK